VKPVCGSATGWEWRDVEVTLTGVWWAALKRVVYTGWKKKDLKVNPTGGKWWGPEKRSSWDS